jgi:hypothetical protein
MRRREDDGYSLEVFFQLISLIFARKQRLARTPVIDFVRGSFRHVRASPNPPPSRGNFPIAKKKLGFKKWNV